MSKIKPSTAMLALWILAAGLLQARTTDRLRVVTSTTDLASLVREVGGERVVVSSLAKGYQDPHFVPTNAGSLLKLHQADLLIVIGLQMESAWLAESDHLRSLLIQSRNPRIQLGKAGYFDVSPYVEVLNIPNEVTEALGIHPLGSPHYWLDPENGRRIARAIVAKLSQLRARDATLFEHRFQAFARRLTDKERSWEQKIRPYRGYKVITYHHAWTNFLAHFGIVSVGEIEPLPGIPPDDKHTEDLIETMKLAKVRVIMVEPCYERTTPRRIANETGARLLDIPESVGGAKPVTDYFTLFDYDIDLLIQAFALAPRSRTGRNIHSMEPSSTRPESGRHILTSF